MLKSHYLLNEDELSRERRQRFLELFQSVYDAVFGLAFTITGTHNDAEDVVQEAVLVMWEKFDQFEEGTNFQAWACSITSRVAKGSVRYRRQRGEQTLSDDALSRITRMRTGGTELLELRYERMQKCMKKLPQKDRDLLDACYRSQETIREIAKRNHWNLQTIYSRLKRIKRRLQDCVDHHMGREVKS